MRSAVAWAVLLCGCGAGYAPELLPDAGPPLECIPGYQRIDGHCETLDHAESVGVSCQANADCGTDPGLFCMQALTGGTPGPGFCTKHCLTDETCGRGATCLGFPTSSAGGVNLCAPAGITPCSADSECTTEGFTCRVFASQLDTGAYSASICSTSLSGAEPAGAPCDAEVACANGLCSALRGASVPLYFCTMPCRDDSACIAILGASGVCGEVTTDPPDAHAPRVRLRACIIGPPTLGTTCQSGATCGADAPHCIQGNRGRVCAPECAETFDARCPTSASTCDSSGFCE